MNEEEALRYAANILRTMSAMQGHNDTYLEAARALDDYFKPAPSGFNAFGHTVPLERQVAALDTAVDIIGVDAMLADPVIRDAARYIGLDKPDEAMLVLRNITDLTGAYRLLSVLCAEPLDSEASKR